MKNKIVALVPMRHDSERVPGKNYRPFNDRPLYHHIISSLLECPLISDILIDTDSPFILEDAAKNFPSIHLVERPRHLRGGTVPMNDVLLNCVQHIKADYFLQTHSTNPLLKPETISSAIQKFLDNNTLYDSLFSVTLVQTRLWNGYTKAINHDPSVLQRTQDLPPVYEENSCLYIFSRKTLEARHNRIGERPLMFEINRNEAWDIDEELDFQIAEFLFNKRRSES
jgi:CMP-N-acetylneuraminic acid synthetase